MDSVAEVVAAGREREGAAVAVPGRTTDYSYDDFCTNVWKTGNLLRHYGLRAGAACAVAVGPKDGGDRAGEPGWPDTADPLLAVLGAGVLGATVDLAPPTAVDARTLVAPAAWLDRYDPAPGCSAVAYGGPPEEPSVVHFERERWSENPMQPPDPAGSDAVYVGGHAQGDLLAAAASVVAETGLAAGDRVAVCAPLTTAGAVAALVAPLTVGATAVLAGPDCDDGGAAVVVGPDGDVDPAGLLSG